MASTPSEKLKAVPILAIISTIKLSTEWQVVSGWQCPHPCDEDVGLSESGILSPLL